MYSTYYFSNLSTFYVLKMRNLRSSRNGEVQL